MYLYTSSSTFIYAKSTHKFKYKYDYCSQNTWNVTLHLWFVMANVKAKIT